MELYEIRATCTNNSTTRTLDYLPENFQGVKITQKFNWQPPMGFTPTFSVETMKVILGDKAWIDAIFDVYSLESVVSFAIWKLKPDASGYELNSTFAIDFESYQKMDFYSEFALKSISCIDNYNLIKNTELKVVTNNVVSLPVTKKFINNVSLKTIDYELNGATAIFDLDENNPSKIYNDDNAIYLSLQEAYRFDRTTPGTLDMSAVASGSLTIYYASIGTPTNVVAGVYKNSFSNLIFEIFDEETEGDGAFQIDINRPKSKITSVPFSDGDVFFVGIRIDNPLAVIDTITGVMYVDLNIETELNANKYSRSVRYIDAEALIQSFFNNQATIEAYLKPLALTYAQVIGGISTEIPVKPKEFMTDFCIATGSLVNFNIDGTVDVSKIGTYFGNLLQKSNAIEITDFKDVTFGYDPDLNFVSVSAGMPIQKYEIYTYFADWNKILTFTQIGRKSSENIDLTLTKYRVDYSGIVDMVQNISLPPSSTVKDLYIFDPALGNRNADEAFVYDAFTPRDILENNRKFLEFVFYNYGKDTLELSSDGGTSDNLRIDTTYQFSDFVFSGSTPRILPTKVNFTCLIENVDFTEKILKIVHNSTELFIFVTEAETTDKLNEQKIKGNLIFFEQES